MMRQEVYLDYNATTPCAPEVIERMLPFFREIYGNPSNTRHLQGRRAAKALDQAREEVAALIGAQPREIIFTNGATESNNLAILGLGYRAQGGKRNRIVISAIEHKAVLEPCKALQRIGFDVIILPVDATGRLNIESVREVIDERTLLLSVHAANNEIGTIQPIREISVIAQTYGALLHCDAAQAVGKIEVDVDEWGVDLLSLSGHKLYGPKGVGALFTRSTSWLEPILLGGGQEGGIRAGTSNVSAIVGLGAACHLCKPLLADEARTLATLRDYLEANLMRAIPILQRNGNLAQRLPNTSSLTFPKIDADALLLNIPHI
ncbi:MAG: cysteine desulfurase, partial [Ardenticatenales bacterium]|nr:cysteine desulfurase [Ardenticatenales bacterium]